MQKAIRTMFVFASCVAVAGTVLAAGVNPRGTAGAQQQTVFSLDTPAANATVFGIVEVKGFILDVRGVSRITLLIDNAAVHDVDINQARDDVRRKYPRFQGEPFPFDPGFTTSFLAANYTDGTHTLALKVTYANSDVATLGQRSIKINKTVNQAPIGAVDSPRDPAVTGMEDVISGVYPIVGWAIDDQGIRATTAEDGAIRADIEVLVDGRVVGQSLYGLPRPDVANAHPDVTNAMESGFQMNLDTTRFTNGQHTLAVRAWDTLGHNRVLAARTVWFENNYGSLGPFGRIDWPMSNAHLYSVECSLGGLPSGIEYEYGHRIEWVSGWVLDQNDVDRFAGVKYVELLLDGVLLKSTTADCQFLHAFNMDVNCYGKERPDILYQYPQFQADAKYSGYFFAIDVDYLVAEPPLGLGIHKGLHYLAVRAGTQDPDRPGVIIDTIPVILECDSTGDRASFGELERPIAYQELQGTELVKGWVIDFSGVFVLNFYVDGILDGSLVQGDPGLYLERLDLEKKYPFLPAMYLDNSGFEYQLDTTKYVDGVHQLVIEAVDGNAKHNYWVQRAVVFDNVN